MTEPKPFRGWLLWLVVSVACLFPAMLFALSENLDLAWPVKTFVYITPMALLMAAYARTKYKLYRISVQSFQQKQAPGEPDSKPERSWLATVYDHSGVGIALLDPLGRVVAANPAIGRIVGKAPESLCGQVLGDLAQDQPDLMGAKGRDPLEMKFRHDDGTVVYCACSSFQHEASRVAVLEDITSQREMARQLEMRAEELTSSNRELEQFAFIASHDLNEPLEKISAFGRLLEEECGEKLTADGKEYLRYMRKSALRMRDLVASLLDLSRIASRGKEFEPVDLNQTVQLVLSDFKLRIEELGAHVEVSPLPVVLADPVQMHQLFQNLIGNALKFHLPDTAPAIIISANENFAVESDSEGGSRRFCKIMVKDEGIGFEQRHAEKIFHVFQRLHPTSVYEGTGMGLAICRKIISRHGGLIGAKSKLGEGSIFAIKLPTVPATDPVCGLEPAN